MKRTSSFGHSYKFHGCIGQLCHASRVMTLQHVGRLILFFILTCACGSFLTVFGMMMKDENAKEKTSITTTTRHTTSSNEPSFYCNFYSSYIPLTFSSSPFIAKLCDGDAYCFSASTKTLTATFSLNPHYDDLSVKKFVRASQAMGAKISGAFNPCYAYDERFNLTSLTSLHVNGQPILWQRKNLGQDIVADACVNKGSCSRSFSAVSSMIEAAYATDLNITQNGNEVTFEFEGTSSPITYFCVKEVELRLCAIPKSRTVVSYNAQIMSTTPSILNFVTNDTVWALQNEPFLNSKELLKSYSDQFVRRVKITNPALAFSSKFKLTINPSMYDFMKSMEIDILGVNKTFTDPVTNQVVMLNISESVSLSRTSSQYELTFNSSLWKDDEISLDIRISLVKPYSYSGFGYFTYDVSPVDSSSNAFYNTFQYGSAQDRFSYTSRQTFNLNFNTPQTISALGNLSDVIAINYSPDPNTPSLDGQLPLCYMQINTIFPDNVFKYSGMIYFYSTKTSKQYSANFGPSFTIDSSKKQAQYMISSEMLDCTQGATTTIYVWLEILSWDSYYDSGVITTQVSASRKTMQLIDDVNKVYSDLTFSSRYEGAVYYVKSFSSLKYPYDLTMSTTFTSLDSPFLSFLSYGVPLSWANQKPMILQSTKTPSSSTDYVAYDVDVTPGMYFTFIEKGSCNVYPCRASFKFSISQDLLSPPVLSTAPSNSLKISKSGYRANGFLTAVEIPQISTRSSQGTPNILYNLKVLASVQVDTQPSSFTITNPLTLQVTKQLQDATQNLPFNSTYSQQIASQNYITSYKCTNTFETHYLVVNTVIQNVNDYGKWYITFYSHPEVSYKVTFTVHLMNNVFSVTQTTNGAKLPILYSPISRVLYGLQLNSQSSFGQTNFMISLDSNTLSFSRNQQYEILFKHGSVPTDTDYDVKSPLLQNVARYPYQQFITRFIYGQNVVLSYLMDNPYYSNGNTRKNFPSSMYSSKVLSDTGNLSNGILYFLIKAIPLSDTMCISDSSLDTPSNFIFAQYQYSSTLIISEGSSKKLNSQVMSIDLSKKPSSPNSEIIADFYQETLSTIFEPSASILFYNSKTKSVQSNSDDSYTNDTASSVQIAFHNLTYLPNGPEFKTPYYSFKYTIRMKIDNTGDSSNQNSQIFLLFPVSLNGFLSPLNNFDAILSMNSKFDPNMYFIDLISPTIIVGSIVGAFSALIAIGYLIATCVFLLASQKREFNLGNPNPKVWLACLCPASIPVSICYIYFFCYEARKNILPPSETKRRRRVRFLIAFSMLSFIVGVLASAYFFGRMFFIHTQAVASANSREYYLGRKDPNADKYSTPSYTPTLMPCCSTARPSTDGQSFTYFGNAHVFFKQKYGGRLDCAPPQWFMDSALGTKFLLQSIDGLPYVSPKHDPAIAATNMKNGRSHTFEMASTYCMANSVILMPADDDYNAYGIPGVLFGIGPILYSFFLMSIVIFESVMNNKMNQSNYFIVGQTTLSSLVKGENVQENTDDKTTLLINEEARNSIYAVYPSAPLHDGDDRNNNNNGMSQSSEESGFQHEEAQPYIHEQLALQQSTNQFTKEY